MNRLRSYRFGPRAVALVGTYVPRRCGIATFTADLLTHLSEESDELQFWALAMNDTPEGYHYPPEVHFEINEKVLTEYRLAADFLNINQVNTVCVQHEYGIYGGPYGSHLLELLRRLRMPIVTTLHTVLQNPNEAQRTILQELARLSDRLVVMSNKAIELLETVYGVSRSKVVMIPHGIPDLPFVDPNFYKDQFGVEGRKVILTFGLVSPGKGLEYMIQALPKVVKRHPDATYIILGATHPHVKREQGESYRLSLHRLARDLRVEDHVIFHNRFVDLRELCEFLGAADIYVTPYLNREQIVSGTLAYALGAGKAIISTPYWYAEEMLAEGRGVLVPFRDPDALAEQVIYLLDNEVERHAMRKRAYTFARDMVWKQVARKYLEVFAEVRAERARHPRPVFQAPTLQDAPVEIPEIRLDHLRRLTDDTGMFQHAKFTVPDRQHGYCTDDNARALIAVTLAAEQMAETWELSRLGTIYLGFLYHAFNPAVGRFRNFMSYERQWLEREGSDDSHARAIWSLGVVVKHTKDPDICALAVNLFDQALPALLEMPSPRAWAIGLAGIHAYLHRFTGDSEARRVRERLAHRLFELYRQNATEDWPWVEDIVAYDNGKIPQALLVAGQELQREDMVQAGLRSLRWLLDIQTDPAGHFVPIGNQGWYRRGGVRARFDQQPLEAQSMLEACIEAYNVTGDRTWLREARRLVEWFLGRNDRGESLYDYRTGGCRDGLTPTGVNENQGAESTLALLLSLLQFSTVADRHTPTVRSALLETETTV